MASRVLLPLMLVLAVGSGATAQALVDARALLQMFMQSPLHDQLVRDALARFPPDVFQRCPALVSKGSTVHVEEAISVGADGLPNAGAWKQSFPVSGCGNDTTLNIYFVASSQEIRTVIAAPGDTLADPRLQADGLKYAVVAAAQTARTCQRFEITNTRWDGYDRSSAGEPLPAPGAKPKVAWNETWTLTGCGMAYDVPMTFVPQTVGTVIGAAPAVAHH